MIAEHPIKRRMPPWVGGGAAWVAWRRTTSPNHRPIRQGPRFQAAAYFFKINNVSPARAAQEGRTCLLTPEPLHSREDRRSSGSYVPASLRDRYLLRLSSPR